MKHFSLLFLFVALNISFVFPQLNGLFKDGDRVCFVGNSITNNGEFYHNILLYHATRFPLSKLSFYNCGVSGDIASGVINRLEDDIMVNKPNKVVIKLGMNDVKGALYPNRTVSNSDTLKLREVTLKTYEANLEKIINYFLGKKINVILQSPSIYDETGQLSANVNVGRNTALKECAIIVSNLAAKYKLPFVDYWTVMNELNTQIQKMNPKSTLTCSDRVHPEALGHFIMAYQFLKTENAPQQVSQILISKKVNMAIKKSSNCIVRNIVYKNDEVSFEVKEFSLPFPIMDKQKEALALVPFQKEFNNQLLQVLNLKSDKYILEIDGVKIDTLTKNQLKVGLNLADYSNTPQYRQAQNVQNLIWELRSTVSKCRDLKFIEYNADFKKCPNKADLNIVKHYMDSVFSTKHYKLNPIYKSRLMSYVENKPSEQEFLKKAASVRTKIFDVNQPISHFYKLFPVK